MLEIVKSLSKVEYRDNLFYKLLEFHLDEIVKDLRSWIGGRMEAGSKETIIKGIQIFRNLKRGGFATYLAPIGEYWSVNEEEYVEEGRKTAQKEGISIERVYILPTYESLFSEKLQKSILEDEKRDTTTYIVFSKDIPKEAIRDFGIWDKEVLCLIDTVKTAEGRIEVRGCSFSNDNNELNTATYWKNEILKSAYSGKKIIGEILKLEDEKRLLLKSANISEKYAKTYCKGSYMEETNCSWYHSGWQYLRLLNLVSTPFWHNEFYIEHIMQEITQRKVQKVLIAGTADYAMLQQVHRSLGNSNDVEITVLGLCRTPLEIII